MWVVALHTGREAAGREGGGPTWRGGTAKTRAALGTARRIRPSRRSSDRGPTNPHRAATRKGLSALDQNGRPFRCGRGEELGPAAHHVALSRAQSMRQMCAVNFTKHSNFTFVHKSCRAWRKSVRQGGKKTGSGTRQGGGRRQGAGALGGRAPTETSPGGRTYRCRPKPPRPPPWLPRRRRRRPGVHPPPRRGRKHWRRQCGTSSGIDQHALISRPPLAEAREHVCQGEVGAERGPSARRRPLRPQLACRLARAASPPRPCANGTAA